MRSTTFIVLLSVALLGLAMLPKPDWAYPKGCPKRIVSLSLASDEIILDIISDRGRIVGVTYLATDEALSNVAQKARGLRRIHTSLEQVLELEPDLVIAARFTNPDFLRRLQDSGINVLLLDELNTIEGIKNNIELIGGAICEDENARALVEKMDRGLYDVESTVGQSNKGLRALYYSPSGFTAGSDTTMGEMIQRAGAINVASQAGIKGHKKISLEFLISQDPDVIILSSDSPGDSKTLKNLLSRSALRELRAVRENRVIVIDARYLTTASHYVVRGIRELALRLHGVTRESANDHKT